MIILTFIALIWFVKLYADLGYLINPGFASVYDNFFARGPFNTSGIVDSQLKEAGVCDGLFGELSTEYTVKGTTLVKTIEYSPFWVAENRWLMAMLLIAFLLIIVNGVLISTGKLPEHIPNIPVYICVMIGIGAYYLTVICFGRYTIEKSSIHTGCLLLVGYLIFVIFFGLYTRRKKHNRENYLKEMTRKHILEREQKAEKKEDDYSSDNLEDYIIKDESETAENESEKGKGTIQKDEKKKLSLPLIIMIVEVLLFLVPIKFCIEAYKISRDYSSNYGLFDPEDISVRTDLEEGFCGNFINEAVDTEEGLFFIEDNLSVDYDGEFHHVNMNDFSVRKLDAEGNITEVYREDSTDRKSKYDIFSIGYSDGYLYLATTYWIIRVDPKDGSSEQVLFPDNKYGIIDCCVVDGKIYYLEWREDYTDSELYEKNRIWVAEINGKDISEPELYASDIKIPNGSLFSYHNSDLLSSYLCGEELHSLYYDGCRSQRLDGKEYHLEMENPYADSHADQNYNPRLFISSVEEEYYYQMDYVGGFNIYNDSIYYIQLTETGFDVCKCDLYGKNTTVIDSYNAGKDLTGSSMYNYKIMIGQGKIYVTAAGYIFIDPDSDYGLLEPGSVSFVTDLE